MTRLLIIALLFIQSCNSGDTKFVNNPKSDNLDIPFYNLILKELYHNNRAQKYEILVELDKDFIVNENIKEAILNVGILSIKQKNILIKNKNLLKNLDSLNINSKARKVIKSSKQNPTKLLKLKYKFSSPFYFNSNKVAIFNSIYYLTPEGHTIKGGKQRLILFKKTANSWIIANKIVLKVY